MKQIKCKMHTYSYSLFYCNKTTILSYDNTNLGVARLTAEY